MRSESQRSFLSRTQRYLFAGLITAIPIWLTWVIFEFFVKQLSKFGMPWVRALSSELERRWPSLAHWILEPWFQSVLGVLLTLGALYVLGWIATQVVGRKMIDIFDNVVGRIPLVKKVYGATKQLMAVIQEKPGNLQRVVLIEFPSPGLKVVGFVMRTLKDPSTGEDVLAVYVPTTPNPTSGYLEIVPLDKVVPTDWSVDEAMTFIVSGGAVAPEKMSVREEAGVGDDGVPHGAKAVDATPEQ
jgi:uncharacterized membrane protein